LAEKANQTKYSSWLYRIAGVYGGLMLAAGQFFPLLAILQLVALIPLMVLVLKNRRLGLGAMAGLYMGLAYTIPQMIYLRLPVIVTLILLVYLTVIMVVFCWSVGLMLTRSVILGSLAVGSFWFLLDWINYTLVPIWGMAQSFARSWSEYNNIIGFISVTGLSGVLFVSGSLQGLIANFIVDKSSRKRALSACLALIMICVIVNISINSEKPAGSIKVGAIGWNPDENNDACNPDTEIGFEELFVKQASQAALEGARIINSGELGFYISKHDRAEWMEKFAAVARHNDIWLIVGYLNCTDDENRLFFMSPEGKVVDEYTKTYLTPLETGKKGNGDLKTVQVDGFTVGAMICQDDNFSQLTRRYGNLKADIVFCPTADWDTVKNGHLQAVRARAIEGRYGIVRGAVYGISAIISPTGELLKKWDHLNTGAGYVVSDIPVYKGKTIFSRFGFIPSLLFSIVIIFLCLVISRRSRKV